VSFGFRFIPSFLKNIKRINDLRGAYFYAYYYLRKKEEDFSRELDKVSLRYIGIGFVAINILLPVCAFY
jgi:hypothetical protein